MQLATDRLVLRELTEADATRFFAMRVCERRGMRKEAHHIENVSIRDEWCDTVIYAVLRREWPTHAA